MKTLRKLAALFCALGMLAPSVAMANFGGTFSRPSIVVLTWSYSQSGAWPPAGTAAGGDAICWYAQQVANTSRDFDCDAQMTWSAELGHMVPYGSVTIKRLSCLATGSIATSTYHTDSSLSFQLVKVQEDGSGVEDIGTALTMPPRDEMTSEQLVRGYLFTQEMNTKWPSNKVRILGLYTPTSTPGTATNFYWQCQAELEVGR